MSTEPKHTPRPWQIRRAATTRYWDIFNAEGYWIGAARRKETADLIAAAPDLLEALNSVMEWTAEENTPAERKLTLIRNAARAAIAKATGKEAASA